MNENDVKDIVTLVRRAPLQNMDEAEVVARLLQRFIAHDAWMKGRLAEALEQKAKEPPPNEGNRT